MNIKRTLVPKKTGGTTTINSGFSSTTNNNSNIDTNNMNVGVLNASDITVSQLNATNATISYLDASEVHTPTAYIGDAYTTNITNSNLITTSSLLVNNNATVGGNLDVDTNANIDGDLTTHGNVTHLSSSNNAFDKVFDIRQVVAYLGDHNYFKELIGEANSSITTTNLTTDYLTVTRSAHFFELVIDKIKAAGGTFILSPADGFDIELIEEDTNYYYLYWRACSERSSLDNTHLDETLEDTQEVLTEKITQNMWRAADQAICQTFNLENGAGTYHDAHNTFWWRKVAMVSDSPILKSLDGVNYYFHWIKVYKDNTTSGVYNEVAQYSNNPTVGDSVAMLGNQTDNTRQGAIMLSCYTNWLDNGYVDSQQGINIPQMVAPYFAEYKGINDFNLARHRHNWIATNNTTLQGNIKLGNGTTVEDYVNDKIADIETGEQFYTNLLVFSNQNINVPCSYNGTPLGIDQVEYIYAYHGNTALNIANATFGDLETSYFTLSGIGSRELQVTLLGEYMDSIVDNDSTPIDVTLNAYLSGNQGDTIQYNGTFFMNKTKDGQKGDDGQTPLVYDVVPDVSTRQLRYTYDNDGNVTGFTISPSTVTFRIKVTDYSRTTNKIYNATSVPDGMRIYTRYFDHDNNSYGSWTNKTTTFNNNSGYVTLEPGASNKYSIECALVIGTSSPLSNPSGIYDIQSVPLMTDGKNGTDGEDGQNGENGENGVDINAGFTSKKAVVNLYGTLNVAVAGQLLYREGTNVVGDHDWGSNIWYMQTTTDNDLYNINAGPSDSSQGSIKIPANRLISKTYIGNDGQFSWNPAQFTKWENYTYSYRPSNIYLHFYDSSYSTSYSMFDSTVPIIYEAGATMQITDQINAYVSDINGWRSEFTMTPSSICTTVNNNSGAISQLEQTATSISSRIGVIESDYLKSDDLDGYATTSYVSSAIEQSASGILQTVSSNYETKSGAASSYNTLNSKIDQTATSILSTVSGTYQTKDAMSNYSTTSQMNSAINQSASGILSTVSATYETKSDATGSYAALSSSINQTAQSISLTLNSVYNTNPNNMLEKTLCLSPEYFYGGNSSMTPQSSTPINNVKDLTSWWLDYGGDITSGSATYSTIFKSSDEMNNGFRALKLDCQQFTTSNSGHPLIRFCIGKDKYSTYTQYQDYVFSLYVKNLNNPAGKYNGRITLSVNNGVIYTYNSGDTGAPVKNTSYGWSGDNIEILGTYATAVPAQSRNGGYIQFGIKDNEWHRIWIRVRNNYQNNLPSDTMIPIIWVYGNTTTDQGDLMLINGLQFEIGTTPSVYGPCDNIEENITSGLKSTGIDIEQGKITISADNTDINGNLNVYNPNEGLYIYDNYSPKIALKNGSIGTYSSYSDDVNMPIQCNVNNISVTGTTKTIKYYYNAKGSALNIGTFTAGSTITISNIRLYINIDSTRTKRWTSGTYNIYINGSVVTTGNVGLDTSNPRSQYIATIPNYTYTCSSNGTVNLDFEVTWTLSTTGTYQSWVKCGVTTNISTIQTIGTDGAIFKTGEGKRIVIASDETNIRYNDTQLRIRPTGIYINDSNNNNYFGNISSTVPYKSLSTGSTTATLTNNDCLVECVHRSGTITINVLPPHTGSTFDNQIPYGKVYYIMNSGGSNATVTITSSGRAVHFYDNGTNDKTSLSLSAGHAFTLLAFSGGYMVTSYR